MALWWYRMGFSRVLLLLCCLHWQTVSPVLPATSCPMSCSCPGVKEVHCTFRHLPTIPKNLPKDTERVNLGYNSLTEVDGSEFRSLRQLEMLMLHGNDISTVHSGAFYSLRSLQILKLSYNKLTLVKPGLFEGLASLVRLHLDHNLITFIEPYSFSGLSSLKLLQLEGNLLKEIHPHTFVTLSLLGAFWTSGLKHLHLSDNMLEQLPAPLLLTAPKLELLSLHGNPWTCDCQLHWLIEWNANHEGVIKCKRERDSGSVETCPCCSSPQSLNGSLFLDMTQAKLPCERAVIHSPLKQWDSPAWGESDAEPDLPYTRDLERPLGHLTFVLSDSHGNSAHVACDVRRPAESSPMTWAENLRAPGEVLVNVSLVTVLECEIDRDTLQNLWRLVAYYYESPAVLERGSHRGNTTRATYQYSQVVNEDSPYFTDLKGYLMAEPSWLLQPKVTLQLNRRQTTTKKLVMDFTTKISEQTANNRRGDSGDNDIDSYWVMIRRGNDKRVQSVNQGTKVHLECDVITSGSGVKVEWMLPDLSLFENRNDQMDISERGELVILNSSLSDSGLYHCMVRTKASVDLLSVRLTVKEHVLSPTAMNGQKMIVEKGRSLTLPCKVTTSLPSQTVWFLPQDQLLLPTQQTRRARVMDNGTLVVKKLTQDDAGEYSCMASNLYGVDMLSHMVEVTGDKESYRSRVETEEGQPVLLGGEEEGEGSGVDYQEIKRPFVTQSPKNVATQQKKPMKRKRIKDSKRKSVNKSVKELDPNRWADMLAKANSKATTAVPTGPALTEPNTTVLPEKPTYKPTTTIIPPTTKTSSTTTTAIILPYTSSGGIANTKPEGHATEKERNMDISGKKRGFLRPSRKRPLGQLPRSNLPLVNRKGEDTSKSVTEPPFTQTFRTFKEPENRLTEKGRVTSSKHSQGRPNRRRPPYRRRPPMRTVQPAQPTSTTTTTTASTTTTTTTTTASTTTIKTASTTTTTSTTTPTTVKMPESSTYNPQTDDYYDSEDSDDKDDDNLDEKDVTDSIHSEITENNGKEITFSKRQQLHNTNHFPITKPYIMPYPTDVTVNDTERNSKIYERESNKLSVDMRKNGQTNKESKDLGGRQKQSSGHDDRWVEEVTQGYNTEDSIHKTTHNKSQPHPKPSEENITPAPTRTSTSKVISSQDKVIHPPQTKQKTQTKPDMSSLPFAEPLHPWLHQHNQRVGQIPSSRGSHTDHDLSRRKEKYKEQNKQRETQKESKLSHVPPTPYWPSHHHHHHHHHQYPLYYPSWPGQKSIHQPRKGAGSYPVPTRRTWPYTHLRTHGSMVTNRPEITADTVKPTARFIQTTPYPSHPYNHHNHRHDHDVGGGSYSVPGDRTQTRDHIILSKLRNRYRQAQLDRIAQLGRRVTYSLTPKPHIPPPHNPYKARQPVPTASVDNPKPKKPVLPALSPPLGHFPTPLPQPNTTPGVLYGSLWPYGGRIGSLRPTAVPPLSGRIEVGESGVRPPRITTVTTASVSVLAESDVYLPCEASGSPTPNLAWTKVSTGATIPANTKYGVRFEVLKNGTFIIRNMQLQDRGQYLCTAKNIFGSDRMVITLAIQTEPPKIQPPKSTEEAIYLGKTVSLHCLASGKPPAQIAWILPDRTFVRDVGVVDVLLPTVSLLQNGTLRIQSANFSSKGDYKCIASNVAGADTITYHLHVAALPPTITESLSDTVHIQQGSSVYIHCSGKGEPEPMLKWILPSGVHVKPSQFLGRRLFIFPNGTLYVRNVVPADAGRYECSATNAVGLSKRTVQLVIRTDPPFSAQQPPLLPSLSLPIPPSNRQAIARPSQEHTVSAMYGSTVYLHCPESTSSQRGTVWQLPSKTLLEHRYSPERPFRVFRNGTLRILQLTEVDGGNYLCIFQRPNGEDMELFQVEVLMTPPRIEHLSTAQTKVSFGENFQVDCVATGMPDPEVSWSLPDGTFINNALQSDDSGLRTRRYVIFDNGTLLLQQMGKIDEGDYTCYAKNKLGSDERKLSVRVGPDAPKVRLNSQPSVTVRLGESVKLSCQSSGEPPPRIVWVSPGNYVISASSDRYQVLEVGVLVVKRVTLVDEGNYACVAQNSAGDDIKNIQLHVEPQEPFINGAKGRSTARVTAIYYQSTLLDCQAEGKPEPTVSWITPYGHTLPSPYLGGRFQVHGNGSLELRGVRKTDEGRFTCLAKSSLGEASLSVDLEVASLAEKPSFAVPNIEIIPIRQDSGVVLLECPARGKPHPEFAWVLPSGTVLSPGVKLQRFIHYLGNGTLRISQPSPGDKGVYRCVAKNVAGQAEKRYSLEVGRKPVIRGATGRIKITYGHSLNLPCSVDGWPQVSITWTLPNGVVLHKPQTTGRISFLVNGTLHLKEVATFDKGTYICKASNSYGSSTLSYPVSVMVFPPRITNAPDSITRVERGTPVTINCMAEGVPKPDISWTLPGRTTLVPHNRFTVQGGVHMTEEGSLVIQNPMLTNSGIYKCNAKNALGTDFKSTYVQVN